MPLAQKAFSVGDLVRWSRELITVRPDQSYAMVEVLGVITKVNGTNIDMKVSSANEAGKDYLNALKGLSAWDKLPVHTDNCEVIA